MRRIAKRILRAVGLEVRRTKKASGSQSRPQREKPARPPVSQAKRAVAQKEKKKSPPPVASFPRDFDEERKRVCEIVRPFTMTNPEKLNAAVDAVEYVVKNRIEGAIVECGVWKGGSSMAMAMTLLRLNAEREFFLYDTYSGMPAPTDSDVSVHGKAAREKFDQTKLTADSSDWARSSLDEVKRNMASTGYPQALCRYVEGKVEETIPQVIPEQIAVLRLDTDWYESTKHEMEHLFPRIVRHGILIVDDYGHWLGSKKAVDEFIAERNIRILLSRVDYSCRMAVKF